jgi:hypothetical protein
MLTHTDQGMTVSDMEKEYIGYMILMASVGRSVANCEDCPHDTIPRVWRMTRDTSGNMHNRAIIHSIAMFRLARLSREVKTSDNTTINDIPKTM